MTLSSQCSQLEEANQAWQNHYQIQTNTFIENMQSLFSFDEPIIFNDLSTKIIEMVQHERNDMNYKYQSLEDQFQKQQSGKMINLSNLTRFTNLNLIESFITMESMRQSYVDTINELNEELFGLKEMYSELENECQLLKSKNIDVTVQQNLMKTSLNIGQYKYCLD